MSEGKISVSYVVNSSEYNKNITSMKKNMQLLNQEVKTSAQEVNTYGKNIQSLTKQQSSINQAVAQSKKIMAEYESQLNKNNTSLDKNQKKLSELSKQKEEANKAYKEAVKIYGEESEQALEAKKSLDEVTKAYEKQEKVVTSNQNAIRNNLTQIEKTKQEQLKLEQQLEETNKDIEEQGNKFIKASEKFATAGTALEKAGGSLKNLGSEVQQAGAIILTASAGVATMASGFESGLAKVNTLVNDSKEGLKAYGESVMELSNNTGVGVTDLTDALYDAISAGIDYSKSTQFINDVNKVAVGGFTDIASASNLLTQVMNIYSKSVDDVGDVSNKLFLVQKNGVTTIGQLAANMGEAMTMGASYNVSLENILSSYASLTKQGRTASTAQTQLKAMIQELGDTGSNVGKVLEEKTAKSFTALMKEGYTLYDALKIVKDSCDGNEDAFNNLWSSTEAGLSAMSLLSKDGEYFNQTLNDMANSAGLADEAFDTMANTSEYKFKKSINETKNSLTKLGESLLPLVDDVSEGISTVADVISKMNPETVTAIAKFGALALVFGTATKATGSLVTILGKGCTGISGLLKIASDTKSLGSFSKALGESDTAVGGLVKSLGGIGVTGGVITGAVAGISAIAIALYANEKAIEKGEEDIIALGDNYDDFSGRLRTNSSLWSEIFGTEYTIKFSDEYKQSMANVTTKVEEWAEEIKGMQEEINNILNDTEIDESTKQEQISSLINNTISEQVGQYNIAKENFINGINQSSYEDFLKTQNYSNEAIESYSENYTKWYQSKLNEADGYYQEYLNIVQDAYKNDGIITDSELANIQEIQEKYALAMEQLVNTSQSDITATIQEEALKQSAILKDTNSMSLGDRKKMYDESLESEKKYWNERYEEIKKDMSLSEEAKNAEKDNIQEKLNNLRMLTEYQKTSCEARALYDTEYAQANKLTVEQITDDTVGLVSTIKDSAGNIISTYLENEDALISWANQHNYTTKEIVGDNGELITVAVNTKGEIVGSVQSMTDAYSLFASDINAYMSDYCKYVKDGQLTTDEALAKIKTDLDTGKISAQDFGFTTNEQFLKVAKAALDADEDTNTLKGSLDGINKEYSTNVKVTGLDEANNKADTLLGRLGNLVSRTWNTIIGVDEAGKKESGGSIETAGIYNVNERGLELIDSPKGYSAYSLGQALQGEYTYIPKNSRVTNAVMTTQKMKDSVSEEVAKQTANISNQMIKSLNNLANLIVNNQSNNKLNLEDIKIYIENITQLNGKVLSKEIAEDVEKEIYMKNKLKGR